MGGGGGRRWKCKPPKYRLELKSFRSECRKVLKFPLSHRPPSARGGSGSRSPEAGTDTAVLCTQMFRQRGTPIST